MSYMYDPRYRRPAGPTGRQANSGPTLEDYATLAQAYREQQAQLEAAGRELKARQEAINVRDEALKRQGEDLKKTQSDLLWTQAELAQLRAAADAAGEGTWQDRYLRLQAEVDTLRRRWEQRATDDTAEARRDLLRAMLPLADHLEMALSHRDALEGEAGKAFAASIETTLKAFLDTLRRYGVEPQDALGAPFDPELHEAVGHTPAPGTPPGHVAVVVQTGYREGERLLRPARVLVSQEPQG